ncbi:probable peptidyl-tRNA hydrolase isoform X1 [Carcharodon carcharias]|uniref:probable peptidyl-tRNA hydrolase isoform X1 n=1 Tax=Carcharodon carcharias TaxID=13397 RepID=UPI001B7E4BBC|nr:probable peptidyl-tRNA hydrolase isoform X1 [Carcharodon carcharias]
MPGYGKQSDLSQSAGALQRAVSSCPCFRHVCGPLHEIEPPPPDGLDRIMMVGMGNYQIQSSRCSVGMAAVNILAKKLNVDNKWYFDRRCDGKVAVAIRGQHQIILLKPQQLMNLNGNSVKLAAEVYQVTPGEIFLIHDQIYLPLGKYVVAGEGENIRDHSGVMSCINKMKSDIMQRIMIGIGPPPYATKRGLLHHKLGRFSEVQQGNLLQVLDQCTNYLLENLNNS